MTPATLALYFVYYNFARVHQTLRVTPAMEAGIADHVWTIEEMVGCFRDPFKRAASDRRGYPSPERVRATLGAGGL